MTELLIKLALVAALIAALFFGEQYIEGLGYQRAQTEDRVAMEEVKREAASTLASEIDKTRTAEQALQDQKTQQERNDADHQKTIADLSDRLSGLASRNAGRLRDPYALQPAGCRPGGGGTPRNPASAAGDRAADPTEADGLLSKQLSDLLRERTREADDINAAYASCRADAWAVRGRVD